MNSASEKMKKSEPKRTWRIRPYTADDRQAVRDICCETGYSGQPIDPIFSDRDVFADFFTRYYTDFEPDAALVVEDQGKIVGYLIGCTRYRLHAIMEKFLVAFVIAPKVIWRMATGRYNRSDRNFLWWSLTRGNKETPAAPKRSSHFHFNLLSAYRAQGVGPALLYAFYEILNAKKAKRVYGQIQTFEDRRTIRAFAYYGFKEYDKKEITKFREHQDKKVFCSTFVKELDCIDG